MPGSNIADFNSRFVYSLNPGRNAQYSNNRMRTTKYTWWSFIPRNLQEQFSRHINRYFLLIACLQLISVITPVSPLTTWVPLLAVFGLSAAKEALDEAGRAKQDRDANETPYTVVREGQLVSIMSEDIHVGDVIRLVDGEQVPCDIFLLASSQADGSCLVQTMNLDGETNLKTRRAIPEIQQLSTESLHAFHGVIQCAAPDVSVYRFDARLWLSDSAGNEPHQLKQEAAVPITGEQLLQQTISLRNTEFIYGVAVYTGDDSKFARNRGEMQLKWTKIDAFINQIAIALFIFQITLVIIFGPIGNAWLSARSATAYYLSFDAANEHFYTAIIIPLRFLLLNSTIIPISLKVTLDVCKLYYSKFIGWDKRLFDDQSNAEPLEPARANNTSISEDLGQIEFVLSDKTGTLTENQMVFRKCSIRGVLFSERDCGSGGRLFHAAANESSPTLDFLRNIALNNSVVPSRDKLDRIVYKSASPDEESLVEAAAELGVRFVSRQGPNVQISVHGRLESYLVLAELVFTSERRRMSVVVRDRDTGSIRLYLKGGDDVVMQRIVDVRSTNDLATLSHLNVFAAEGLRTLAFCHRDLSENEYSTWLAQFNLAQSALTQREDRLSAVYDLLEKDLELSGASAIEDRLQIGVQETIKSLRTAGVRFWMLTGDKFSTALQIAQTCSLRSRESGILLEINALSEHAVGLELDQHHNQLRESSGTRELSVILRGASLGAALALCNHARFLSLCMAANAVICCRFSPKQKSLIVKMVRDSGKMTLAIGDGGNDVSMIQQAHVGVGIRGKEGLQASRAADFQINNFRSLLPLMLIHGRQSYLRTALVAQYSYYKSFEFCLIQIIFGFANGFSGSALFNSACIAAYNAVLFVPILTFVLDQDLTGDQVLRQPEIYKRCQQGLHITWRTYFLWMLRGLFQAIVIYVVTVLVYSESALMHNVGHTVDGESLGLFAFFTFLFVQSATMLLEMQYVTSLHLTVIGGFHALAIGILYASSSMIAFDSSLIGYHSVHFVLADPVFWFGTLFATVCAIVPVLLIKVIAEEKWPSPIHSLRRRLLELDADQPESSQEGPIA